MDSLTALAIVRYLDARGIRAMAEYRFGRAVVYVRTDAGELPILSWQDFRAEFPA